MSPEEFKAEQDRLGFTATQMGELLGLDRSNVNRRRNGQTKVTAPEVRILKWNRERGQIRRAAMASNYKKILEILDNG